MFTNTIILMPVSNDKKSDKSKSRGVSREPSDKSGPLSQEIAKDDIKSIS
jgi:hypothetical protein